MRTTGFLRIQAVSMALAVAATAQTSGLQARVPNTTLKMPAEPVVYGYAVTRAFGSLAFSDPTAIAAPPGETNRLFVAEQLGRVAVITNLASPTRSVFLDLSSRVIGGAADERGLLGLVFHPGYATNRYFFVVYSTLSTTPGVATDAPHQRLSRFEARDGNPDQADSATEVVLINQYDRTAYHNAGDLHFGPDGYLYASVGDDSNGDLNSQRIDQDFFSGILRLDVDKGPGNPEPNPHPSIVRGPSGLAAYSVPADNPFIGATVFNGSPVDPARVRTEFWAVGLRNPWRFSFDPSGGTLYCADVGDETWEEVDVVEKGGNFGWNYFEGTHAYPPGSGRTPPAGFAETNPIFEYHHGSAADQGNSITGGLVYRGSRIPQLFGAYLYADFIDGNIWALRYDGTTTTSLGRLAVRTGVTAFGTDPRNGDVLMADRNADTITRLTYDTNVVSGAPLPPTLADTGAFRDLAALTPNPGIVPYEINLPFWSDNALKRRWFTVPDTNDTIGFAPDGNWSFPTGSIWIKHFDLELTRGDPASAHRLETRFIVRNTEGVYGVTYRWNSPTNATLVPQEGMDETFIISDGGTVRTQVWHYPSRAECLSCHTDGGGLALGFNTGQLNRAMDYGNGPENQIAALDRAGYFSSPVRYGNTLPALAHPTNTDVSLDYRVHSYLSANCAQCHQPGGTALGQWDARITTPLSGAGIINGLLNNNLGDASNRVIVPGSLDHSIALARILTRGTSQMPPIDSTVLDDSAMALLTTWITNGLSAYQGFADWQAAHFTSPTAPDAAPDADPDGDGASNLLEYLTGTDPQVSGDAWRIQVRQSGDSVEVTFPQLANRGFLVEWTPSLSPPVSWQPLDVPGNRPFFSSKPATATVSDSISDGSRRYYRVRVFEP